MNEAHLRERTDEDATTAGEEGSAASKQQETSGVGAVEPSPFVAVSMESWAERGVVLREQLRTMEIGMVAVAFSVGDWVNEGEERFGQSASQFIDQDEGWSYWKVNRWARIARLVPPENRSFGNATKLTLEHFRIAAALPVEEQREALEQAADGRESAAAFKARVAPSESAETERCPMCGSVIRVKSEHSLSRIEGTE